LAIASIITTDFDGNNTIDLVVRGGDGSILIGLGTGTGDFQSMQVLNNLSVGIKSIAIGDFDGYGLNDLLIFTATGITLTPGWSIAVQQSAKPGIVTSVTHDAIWNQPTSETDEFGRKILYEVDPATGNRLSITQVVGLVDTISGETNDVITRYTYTTLGLLDTEIDALGRIKNYDYDSKGNLVRLVQAQGTSEEITTLYEYDLAGNQTAVVDPLGRRTEHQYNIMNMLVRTIEADPDGMGPQASPVTDYEYDRMGHQILIRDSRGNVTRFEYDKMGRTTRMIGADPDGGGVQVSAITTYEYDLMGNTVAVIDPLGRRTTSIYDARNRRIVETDSDGGSWQIAYDIDNHIVGEIDANGNRTSKIYDSEGRVVREINALGQIM
jgi:YD repeat-containing protein